MVINNFIKSTNNQNGAPPCKSGTNNQTVEQSHFCKNPLKGIKGRGDFERDAFDQQLSQQTHQ